jgi:flagellar basal body-associated protein FliL
MTPPVIKEQRAKQGREGKPVLTILLVSLSILAIAIVVYLFWVGSTSPPVQEQETTRPDIPITSPASPGNPIPTAPPGQPGQAR